MLKLWLLILLILVGVYLVNRDDPVDALVASAELIVHQAESGIQQLKGEGGSSFDPTDLAQPGLVTVVEFYTDACPGCKRLRQHYKRFLKQRPDVAVRRVWMPDNWSVVWAQRHFGLDIGSTPHIHIYDAQGQPVAVDVGNDKAGFDLLYEWMNAELKKGNSA